MVSMARAANTSPIPLALDVPNPIYFQESDITDQKEEHYLSNSFIERELPPRPTSRLAYNCAVMGEANRPQSFPIPGAAILFSSSMPTDALSCLAQIDTASISAPEISTSEANSGDFTMDIATLDIPIDCRNARTSNPNPELNGVQCPPFDEEVNNSDELDSDCSYDDFELEDISPPPQICPVPVRKSISYLCFPFVTTPSPKRTPPPPPPPPPSSASTPARPKYSILPSPLSPTYSWRPHSAHLTPARHNYHQHGHSNHALNHFKWFWSIRQNEWDSYSTQILAGHIPPLPNHSTPGPITDSSNTPLIPVSVSHITPKSPPPSLTSRCQLPPMSIHPRRGDLSSLRDPYCVDIDRFFVGLPTWTIGKTLWIFDVHVATQMRIQDELEEANLSRQTDTDSECESASTFESFSDDSDVTLVDDEEIISASGSYEMDQDSLFGGSSSLHSSSPSPSSSLASVAPVLKPPSWMQETYLSQTSADLTRKERSSKLGARPSFWATNWYRRWEILIELSHRNHIQLPPLRTMPMTPVNSQSPPSSKFYLADLDAEEDEAWSEIVGVSGGDCVEKDVLVVCPPLTRLPRQRQVTV